VRIGAARPPKLCRFAYYCRLDQADDYRSDKKERREHDDCVERSSKAHRLISRYRSTSHHGTAKNTINEMEICGIAATITNVAVKLLISLHFCLCTIFATRFPLQRLLVRCKPAVIFLRAGAYARGRIS